MIRKRVLRSKRRINRKALRSKRKTSNKWIRKKSIRRRQKGGEIVADLSNINPTQYWKENLVILNSHYTYIYNHDDSISNYKLRLLQYAEERIKLWSIIHNYCSLWTSSTSSVTNLDNVKEQLKRINSSFNLTYAICRQKLSSLETKKTTFESFKIRIEESNNDIKTLKDIFKDVSVQFKDELNNTGLY
jgi:hypothetical protein